MGVGSCWHVVMTGSIVTAIAFVFAQPAKAVEVSICHSQGEETCVIDGDTIVWERETIRIENIDAPELDQECAADLGAQAATRLAGLLSSGEVQITRSVTAEGHRTRATVTVNGKDVGIQLVSEGLARKWMGSRETWCR